MIIWLTPFLATVLVVYVWPLLNTTWYFKGFLLKGPGPLYCYMVLCMARSEAFRLIKLCILWLLYGGPWLQIHKNFEAHLMHFYAAFSFDHSLNAGTVHFHCHLTSNEPISRRSRVVVYLSYIVLDTAHFSTKTNTWH